MRSTENFFSELAVNLATDLFKYGATRLGNAVFGDDEIRALRTAWKKAFATMLNEVAGDLDEVAAELLDDILHRFVADEGIAKALLDLALVGDKPDLPLLRKRFDALDYNASTLDVDFDTILTALTHGLTDALLAASMEPESPIHNRVSLVRVAAIHNLLREQRATLATISEKVKQLDEQLPAGAKYNLIFLGPANGFAIGDEAVTQVGTRSLFKDIFTPHFTQSVNYYPDIPSFSELINREDEVESISKSITNRDQKPPSFITICGMPEIGKTALAAHLFHLHRTNSVWVSPGLDLERCEDYLNRISRAVFMGQEQPIIAVNHELHLKDFWLFLDGVDAFIEDDKFRGFLSRLSPRDKGKVVATSVSQIGLPSEYWLELSGLSLDDAVALFDNRWQRKNRNLSDAQLADVRTICGKNLLSGHPASIERIAANLGSKKRADLSTVVTRLRRDIQQASDKEGKAILTVDISLQSRTEQATNLLARLSLLPGKFDDGVVRILSEISPSLSWQDAIDELIIARLIQVNHRIDETSVYLVPSVVKAVARQKVRELPELKDLQKCVGNLLVQSSKDSEWAYGLCNLYKGEKWAGVLSAFKERYNASFFGEHLFVESNLTLINRASACYAIAYSFDQTGNANYARDYAEKGRDLLDSITSDSSLVYKALFLRLHTVYARNLLLLGEFPAGQRVIEFLMRFVESLDQNQSEDLQWECGQVYLLEGIYFHYLKGNDEQADRVSRKALDIYSTVDDEGQRLRALSNLGTAFEGQGRLRESANISCRILEQLEEQKRFSTLSARTVESLVASETANLVDVLTKLGEFNEANQRAHDGLEYCEAHALYRSYVALLINTGALEIELKEYEQAHEKLSEALRFSRDLGYSQYEDQTYSYLAAAYSRKGDFAKAKHNMERALSSEYPYCVAEAHRIAGEIHIAQGNYDLAKQDLLRSKQRSHNNGYTYFEARASLVLGQVFRHSGDVEAMESNLREAEEYFSAIEARFYLKQIMHIRNQ